jgi:small subunit ribosomal protein S20
VKENFIAVIAVDNRAWVGTIARLLSKFRMANTKSAKKNIRKTTRRTAQNRAVLTRLKTLAKEARAALSGDDAAKAATIARAYVAAMDKAAKTYVIHHNKAARAKSAMAKVLTPAKAKA